MGLRKRFVVGSFLVSVALNGVLVMMVANGTALMNQLSDQVERSTVIVGELTNSYRSTVSEASQLRDELRGCRIDLIKRMLGVTEPAAPAPPAQTRSQAS